MTQKQLKIFYPIIFFLGVILMIWQINIYRNTIIDLSILIGLILIAATIVFITDFKNFKKTYNYRGIVLYLYASMHYIIGFGFITCSIFILANYYFADSNIKTESYEIIDRYELGEGGGRKIKRGPQPAFVINYNGQKKELVFYTQYLENMNSYKTVEIDTRNGFFGFKILENKKLN